LDFHSRLLRAASFLNIVAASKRKTPVGKIESAKILSDRVASRGHKEVAKQVPRSYC